MSPRSVSALAVALLAVSACGGGSDGAEGGSDSSEESANEENSGEEAADASGDATGSDSGLVEDLPQFLSDFDRVCTTETGFGGATPLTDGPGPHPFVLMQESDSEYIFERDLNDAPAGWNIQTDGNFDDNSEIVPTELIACALRVGTTPTGIMCEFEDDEGGDITTLELVDVTYEVTMREATTGNAVGTETIEASDTDCPFFVSISEGDTQTFNSPTEDQYINAVKPYVMP